MTPLLARIRQATALTRGGDLRTATQSIHDALGLAAAQAHERAPVVATIIDRQAPEACRPALLAGPRVERKPHVDIPGGSEPQGAFLRRTCVTEHGRLDHRLFVPPGHQGQALPLIVMLHGCTQDPECFAAGTGMNQVALERGFFVLYPEQPASANPNRCWNWFEPGHQNRSAGEPALIAAATRAVIAEFGIDGRRVYVAGLSAGGAMAAILGETYPDVFAAVGVHSGLPTGCARDLPSAFAAMKGPSRLRTHEEGLSGGARSRVSRPAGPATPTIVFHGDRDTTVHRANGRQIIDRVADASINTQVSSHERKQSANGRHYTRTSYRDATGKLVGEHWSVHGAGHAWSGGRSQGSYTDPTGPDATHAIVQFFLGQ